MFSAFMATKYVASSAGLLLLTSAARYFGQSSSYFAWFSILSRWAEIGTHNCHHSINIIYILMHLVHINYYV
jgi:hypothetical protein